MGWYLFWLPSVTKTKYASFGTPTWWDVQIGCFWPILRNFTDQDGQKGESHENEFWVFQIQKRMLPTNRAEKVDEKNGVIYLVFMFPLWVVKLSKRVKFFFSQFCANFSKKLKFVIYMHLKFIIALFEENDMVYRGLSHHSWNMND